MWENLQHCLINADVDMELPASLLPSTLQSLNLSFRSRENVKDVMSLSLLQRLPSLKSLGLNPVEWDLQEDAPETYFLQARSDQLKKLKLRYLPLQVSEGLTLSDCLPKLTDLHVLKAQAVLDLPSLQRLNLKLLCKVPRPAEDLSVLPSSKLQVLTV